MSGRLSLACPPAFVECVVCGRLFGSRSIGLHRAHCIQQQQQQQHQQQQKKRSGGGSSLKVPSRRRRSRLTGSIVTNDARHRRTDCRESIEQRGLNSSWPSSATVAGSRADGGACDSLLQSLMAQQSSAVQDERAKTATVKKPLVLDAGKYNYMDMSLTRCSELLKIVSLNRRVSNDIGYHSDSEVVEAASLISNRPHSFLLRQRTRNVCVPSVESEVETSALEDPTDSNVVTNVSVVPSRKRLPNFTKALEQLIQTAIDTHSVQSQEHTVVSLINRKEQKESAKVSPSSVSDDLSETEQRKKLKHDESVTPCTSCTKNKNPEKFHTHPVDLKPVGHIRHRVDKQASLTDKKKLKNPQMSKQFDSRSSAPIIDPVALRKQKLAQEHVEKQRRLKEDYAKKVERSRRAREEALKKKLAFVSKCGRSDLSVDLVACYICDQQVASSTYTTHQTECLQKWREKNNQLPQEERKPEPRPSSGANESPLTHHHRGSTADSEAVDCVTCSMCSRKIPGHRLSIHERSCRKLTSSANKTPEQITESLCYVCKLRFPISTLASHEIDCLQQWQAKQEGRPTPTPSIPAEKSEQKKTDKRSMVDAEPVKEESSLESGDILPLDVECKELNQEDGSTSDEGRGNSQKLPSDNATETSANLSGETSETNQNTEIKADEAWSQHIAQLVPCRKCGRTFLPERLDKHVKNCKLKPVKKKV